MDWISLSFCVLCPGTLQCVYTTPRIVLSHQKTLFYKPLNKELSCCLHVGGKSNTAAHKGSYDQKSHREKLYCDVSSTIVCISRLAGFVLNPCQVLSGQSLHCLPTWSPACLCLCFITCATVNHPVMLIKCMSYEVPLFAAEHHWTWPVIKPQKRTLMMKLSWLMRSLARVRRRRWERLTFAR